MAIGMPDYEQQTHVDAPAQALFDYLADVRHLPLYFSGMTSAEPGDGEEVHTTAEVNGQEAEGDAWFRVDRDGQSLAWGSEGPNDYHGRLEVEDDGDGSSVRVHLHTDRVASDEIDEGLKSTMANVKRLVEDGSNGSTG